MSDTADRNKALLQDIFAELSSGSSRPLLEALADDVTWTVKGTTPWSRTYSGKAAVLALLRELGSRLATRYRAEATLVLADGEHVVVAANGSATTIDGRRYDNQYCFLYRLRDGAIVEVIEYLDTQLVVAALGSIGSANPGSGVR